MTNKNKKNKTILAIDTSSAHGSIGLQYEETADVRTLSSGSGLSHRLASLLIPEIITLLQDHQMTLHDITVLAITRGPGSFTGLRIGLAAAQGLVFAMGYQVAQIVALSTLDVLAASYEKDERFVVSIDTQRDSYYSQMISANGLAEEPCTIRSWEELTTLNMPIIGDTRETPLSSPLLLAPFLLKRADQESSSEYLLSETLSSYELLTPFYGHTPEYRKKQPFFA